MRVAIGQFCATPDRRLNLETMQRQVREAARQHARLIVFPEFSMWRQPLSAVERPVAEPLDGPFVTALARWAGVHGLVIVAGMTEAASDDERVFNTVVVVSAAGELASTYRKIHLYDAFGEQESRKFRAGEVQQYAGFDIDELRFGLLTCYDLRFPELARLRMEQPIDVLIIPAAWSPGPRKDDHWNVLTRARAIENTVYLVAADQAPPLSPGGSRIIDPIGALLGEAREREDVVCAELQRSRVEEVRASLPCLDHRRLVCRTR